MLAGILLTLISVWVGQNHGLMPVEASEAAPLIDGLFDTMMMIGTGLFLLVTGVIFVAVFKFRRQPGDETDGSPVHGNIPLEILWTSIPAVIVLGLAIYSFEVYSQIGGLNPMEHSVAHGQPTHQMANMPGAAIAAPLPASQDEGMPNLLAEASSDANPQAEGAIPGGVIQKEGGSETSITPGVGSMPGKENPSKEFVIQANGLQYAWIFTYPDSGVVAGELHVPVGREVLLDISASDVLHAFWVPEFRLKQDAVPGQPTELRFTPNRIGEYPVICAELCGPYHGAMRTKVIAESPADFAAWVQEQKVASANGLEQTIAVNPTDQAPDEFLAPYADRLGVRPELLHQLHSASAHVSSAS
ncbi:cytochrome c oxidase subunit II [Stenomitos frigidus]|uniref:Cytochrome c oxidase subunit 2 n=2 Tax=Stenomitos TaxID=1844270 RepID=A0A2T1E532_9CYAN|nr:cytochrome C oxidase subunit II [Stenomitos frigidus ULC18]